MSAPLRAVDPELAARRSAAARKAWETMRARGIKPARPAQPSIFLMPDSAPAVALAPAPELPPRETADDERQWAQLEAERDAWLLASYEYTDIRPAYVDRPHPRSEGAHLPMRGLRFNGPRGRHAWPLTPEEKRAAAPAVPVAPCQIRKDRPHPLSEGADLPLRGLTQKQHESATTWAPSKAELRSLAARPIVHHPNVWAPATFNAAGRCEWCGQAQSGPRAERCPGSHRVAPPV